MQLGGGEVLTDQRLGRPLRGFGIASLQRRQQIGVQLGKFGAGSMDLNLG
jgi:hypothetical protein